MFKRLGEKIADDENGQKLTVFSRTSFYEPGATRASTLSITATHSTAAAYSFGRT